MQQTRALLVAALFAGADAARSVINTSQLIHAHPHDSSGRYGTADCPCIGVDALEGHTVASLGKWNVSYPSDLGARCETWDHNIHPQCPGHPWCESKWCYVDPCNCKGDILPKPSTYIPESQYRGKPVYFSYQTCGGKDTFSAEDAKKSKEEIEQVCRKCVDDYKWGQKKCRCVGIGPQPGVTKVMIEGEQVDFPADAGSYCAKWEKQHHPDCNSSTKAAPEFCEHAWCYVDPCDCDHIQEPPKTSGYVPHATIGGRPVYYSYATCGGQDIFTRGREDACVTKKTKEECNELKKCGWNGNECWGRELLELC